MVKPTYLYIKQHNKTGLKYFGKTTSKNPIQYPGSGLHWQRHLQVHGNDVSIVWYQLFEDQDECVAFAKEFSRKNHIVESLEWANLKPEDGLDGGNHTEEIRKKIDLTGIGRQYTQERNEKIQKSRQLKKDEILYKGIQSKYRTKKNT
jgi:hypothetical protein